MSRPPRQKLSLPKRPTPPTRPQAPSTSTPAAAAGERLQKLLAAAGFGSRREIETWITAGRVSVRGQVAKLGDRAAPEDEVLLDGKEIKFSAARGIPRVILYHKPVGELVTRSDPEGRPTVFAKLPPMHPGRWVNVGRLDFNTSGLLLFTDSGELANTLMHPRHEFEREYEMKVEGGLSPDAVRKLREGVQLEDGPAKFLSFLELRSKNSWYRGVLMEGRNREVRRMIEAVGAKVSRLIRVRFGAILLPLDLPAGRWLELDARKIRELTDAAKG